jgi:hypothetical protein
VQVAFDQAGDQRPAGRVDLVGRGRRGGYVRRDGRESAVFDGHVHQRPVVGQPGLAKNQIHNLFFR